MPDWPPTYRSFISRFNSRFNFCTLLYHPKQTSFQPKIKMSQHSYIKSQVIPTSEIPARTHLLMPLTSGFSAAPNSPTLLLSQNAAQKSRFTRLLCARSRLSLTSCLAAHGGWVLHLIPELLSSHRIAPSSYHS